MTLDQPAPAAAAGRPLGRRAAPLVCLALLLLSGVVFAERWHTRQEPLERDQPTYAVVANEVLHGRPLYTGVFDQKPPAPYLTYAAAELLTGYERRTVFYLGVFAALVTLPGIYLAGAVLTGRRRWGLCAAGLWTLLNCDLRLEANQPNTEAFMNACVTWALYLMVRPRRGVVGPAAAAAAGLLFAWATLYKPVVIAEAVCLLGAYALLPPGGAANRAAALGRGLIVAATVGGVWGGVTVFFAAEGHFRAFYDALVVYNRFYAGSLAHNLGAAFNSVSLVPRSLSFCLPLVALDCAGVVASARRGLSWQWASLLGLAAGTYVAIVLPGRFYAHYFQLWLPLLCVAPAYALATLADVVPARRSWPALAAGLAALLVVLGHELPFYRLSATAWSLRKYGTEFVEADRAGGEIARLLAPGETFYDAEVEPEMYLKAGRRPPTGIFYAEPLRAGPFAGVFARRVRRDLSAAPPQLVVSQTGAVNNPIVWSWVRAHYAPLGVSPAHPHFTLWVLTGGPLAARLRGGR